MPSTLFILLKSPHEYCDLDVLAAMGGEDRVGVLLFEDASLFAVYGGKRAELQYAADYIYVMGDDLAARGFRGMAGEGIEEIDYPRAVDLIMEEYDRTITL